ncbi:MAG: hypothetical protein ACRD0P_24000, partial [Stackebrandtia sp.]
ARTHSLPLYATPEFVGFGALGTGAEVGWLVPAPELELSDHPVVLASGHDCGVTMIGPDTRSGLEFMLSWCLRRWREDPDPAPPAGRDPQVWLSQNRWRLDARARDRQLARQLAAALDVRPDPDHQYSGSTWDGTGVAADTDFDITFVVPHGWRHEAGKDGIGVLAPSDAFAAEGPLVADGDPSSSLFDLALADAAEMLDAGYPATALLGLKDSFVNAPTESFAELRPLWARAYRDLGRPRSAQRLDTMAPTYDTGNLP